MHKPEAIMVKGWLFKEHKTEHKMHKKVINALKRLRETLNGI